MINVSENQPTSTNHHHILESLDFLLRLFVIPLSAASIWVTVTSNQDNISYGKLEFRNLVGLKYMVCINAISAVYAIYAIISSWLKCILTRAWVFFVSDQVVAYLMVTSGAAVLEILYLAHNGDQEVSWSEACSSYGKFCNRVNVALILHGIALLCFLALSMMSALRVFSRFEPPTPVIPYTGVEEERS